VIPLPKECSNPPAACFSLKLLAVNDSKQKLIGLYQLKLNLSDPTRGEFEPHREKKVLFDKCIDKEGSLTYSCCLKEAIICGGTQEQTGETHNQSGTLFNRQDSRAMLLMPNNDPNLTSRSYQILQPAKSRAIHSRPQS
jgi:hypothetical protein